MHLPAITSSVPSPMGEEVTSEARKYARLSAGNFFSAQMYY